MVYQSRTRKRICAIQRAPDGSAFQKCEGCGTAVAIALADMHDCGKGKNATKKRKIECGSGKITWEKIKDQPRSAFHFFMEELEKEHKDENEMEIMKIAWKAWLNKSKEERLPFLRQANKLHTAYMKLLKEEENAMLSMQTVDDEADSAEVGRYDKDYEKFYKGWDTSGSSGGSGLYLSETYE